MRVPKVVRVPPLSSLFLFSWMCGVLGTMMGLIVDQGVVGAIWQILVIPSYVVFLLGTMLGVPFWLWIGLAVGMLGLADLSLYVLRQFARD